MTTAETAEPENADPAGALRRGVLFVAPLAMESATARYRCGHLAEALALRGVRADVVSARDQDLVRIDHDVVVLHRLAWGGPGRPLAEAARRAGAAVVCGVDDLIFLPDYAYQVGLSHPDDPPRYHYSRGEADDALRMMAECDAVLASTDFLAERAAGAVGAKDTACAIVRNFLSSEMVRLSREASARSLRETAFHRAAGGTGRVVLGYLSGSPTHDRDLADIARPLAAAMRRHPETRLLVVGTVALPGPLAWAERDGRVMRHPYVPWRDLPGLLAGIDINLAPVDPTRAFNHAKSEIKFLEAAAVGVPTVAGWAAGFAEGVGVVKPFGGALPVCEIAGSLAQWEETLADLIADPERRRTLGERAQRAVLAGATSEVRADFIVKTFADLAALRRADTGTGPVTVPIRTSKEKAERALRRAEATAFRVWLRLRRHWRLLADEVGGGG